MVAAAFMAVAEVFTAEEGVVAATTRAAEAPAVDPMRHRLQATVVRVAQAPMLRAQAVNTQRGPATAILDPAVISQAVINGMAIRLRRHLLPLTASGIHLAAHPEAVDLLRPRKRKPAPQATQAAFTY